MSEQIFQEDESRCHTFVARAKIWSVWVVWSIFLCSTNQKCNIMQRGTQKLQPSVDAAHGRVRRYRPRMLHPKTPTSFYVHRSSSAAVSSSTHRYLQRNYPDWFHQPDRARVYRGERKSNL